jgi:hypothetical protein
MGTLYPRKAADWQENPLLHCSKLASSGVSAVSMQGFFQVTFRTAFFNSSSIV